jgi:hypothetical protein
VPVVGVISENLFIPVNELNLDEYEHLKLFNMGTPEFPNGFESWQKTHFEVVEVLCYIRSLEEGKQPKSFTEMLDQSATDEMYQLALNLTNKFEEETKGRKRERFLFDEIEDFVWNEVRTMQQK